MTSIAYSSVSIQTSAQPVPSIPNWFGEVTAIVSHLQHQGVLAEISEQVRFARRRFGRYEVIDFLAVLFGYAISGERTLEAFYERLQPFAVPFMAQVSARLAPSSLNPFALFGSTDRGTHRSPPHALSGGPPQSPTCQRAPDRGPDGSNERPVGDLRS